MLTATTAVRMKFWQNASLCTDCIAKIKPFLLPKTSWAQIATKALLKSLNVFQFFRCCNFNPLKNQNIFTKIKEIMKIQEIQMQLCKRFFTIVLNLAKNLLAKKKKGQRPKGPKKTRKHGYFSCTTFSS